MSTTVGSVSDNVWEPLPNSGIASTHQATLANTAANQAKFGQFAESARIVGRAGIAAGQDLSYRILLVPQSQAASRHMRNLYSLVSIESRRPRPYDSAYVCGRAGVRACPRALHGCALVRPRYLSGGLLRCPQHPSVAAHRQESGRWPQAWDRVRFRHAAMSLAPYSGWSPWPRTEG